MAEGPPATLRDIALDSGFFVLRTPLLPFGELLSWGDGLQSASRHDASKPEALEEAWALDVRILRTRLRAVLDRPEILQALYIASPALRTGIDHWRRDPDSKKGLQAERSIVRYFERMCTRPTPFGLFSGCSVGSIAKNGEKTSLNLRPRSQYRTSSRLDFDYLFALSGALRRDDALRLELTYWPNSSLRLIAGAWHYTESRLRGTARSHHLVKLEDDQFLAAALSRAAGGASVTELVDAIIAQDTEDPPSEEEAREFVLELVGNDVLVPALAPLVTGEPALEDLIRQLRSFPSGVAASTTLERARHALAELDATSPGSSPDVYEAIADDLKALPAAVDPARLYQVDMRKPVVAAHLGVAVMDELLHAAEILARFGQSHEPDDLKTFRDAFSQRYDRALVPLLEALDEETGLSFGQQAGEAAPLLRGLQHGAAAQPGQRNGVDSTAVLLRKLALGGQRLRELELAETELPPLAAGYSLPDSFCLFATLVGSPAAVAAGDFQLFLRGGVGPSGARLFGRFCHADPELERCVRQHLREEERHDPDAVYAEIVYVPEGRVGNVICRPSLRDYEIPYLGRSGAPGDRQLPLTDLLIGMEGSQLVVRSRRLGKRVIPRLTSAHGFMNPTLPAVYRLLCSMQHQGKKYVPSFSWGALDSTESLPRVRVGRVVLSLAKWRLSKSEVDAITQPSRSAAFGAVQKLRVERGLPRWILYHESDNVLPADLDNPLSVDALTHVLKRSGGGVAFTEMFPEPDELCVHSEEGHFCHDLNVPLVLRPRTAPRTASTTQTVESPSMAVPAVDKRVRTHPPGSEWLYVKLYGGNVVLDEVLTTVLPALVEASVATGAVSRWFFIRYADPQDHVRIRFHGAPDRLQREVLPLLTQTLNPLLSAGRVWKVQLDTYEREIERYGGVDATIAAEDYFCADSIAVLDILRASAGDEGQDARWRAALYGVDRLLADFGLDLETRRVTVGRWRDQRYSGAPPKQQLADRLRTERRALQTFLWAPRRPDEDLEFVRVAYDGRSRSMAPVVERLRRLAADGRLAVDTAVLLESYAHMHVNRMIRFAANAHELVIYDFLSRLYEAEIARRRRATTPPAAALA